MAKRMYIGQGGLARRVKKIYVGAGGYAARVKKAYVGIGGTARPFSAGASRHITAAPPTLPPNASI